MKSCLAFFSSPTGRRGTNEKLALQRGVLFDDAGCGREICAMGDTVWASFTEVEEEEGELFSGGAAEVVGSSGNSRMGTESRYGRIAGSTSAVSSRFFHFEGVKDGAAAKRETG